MHASTAASASTCSSRQATTRAAAPLAPPPRPHPAACSSSSSSSQTSRSSAPGTAFRRSHTRPPRTSSPHAIPSAAAAAASLHKEAASGKVGIVIVDHGSRKAESNLQLFEFARLFKELTGAPVVECAHMEIAQPSIEHAIGQCVAQGVDSVVIAPYFLSRGRHIQEDIPHLVREAQDKFNGVRCVVAEPIGVDSLMAQLICNRVNAAVAAKTA